MATHHGKDGTVKIGNNTMAEVTDFNYEESAEVVDDTAMGDTWATHLVGQFSWTASITCHWDETDTNGQEACTIGSSVTVKLYPEGGDSGDHYVSGTGTITRVGVSASMKGVVGRTIQVQGNGAPSWGNA